jgi:hypothetical protein
MATVSLFLRALLLVQALCFVDAKEFNVANDEEYLKELAKLDHQINALNKLRHYSRRHYVGDHKYDSTNYMNLEEIVKAYSKGIDDSLEVFHMSHK